MYSMGIHHKPAVGGGIASPPAPHTHTTRLFRFLLAPWSLSTSLLLARLPPVADGAFRPRSQQRYGSLQRYVMDPVRVIFYYRCCLARECGVVVLVANLFGWGLSVTLCVFTRQPTNAAPRREHTHERTNVVTSISTFDWLVQSPTVF